MTSQSKGGQVTGGRNMCGVIRGGNREEGVVLTGFTACLLLSGFQIVMTNEM